MRTLKCTLICVAVVLGLVQIKEIYFNYTTAAAWWNATSTAPFHANVSIVSYGGSVSNGGSSSENSGGSVEVLPPPPSTPLYEHYKGAPVEDYVLAHADELGYNSTENPSGCSLWKSSTLTPHHDDLSQYAAELAKYTELLNKHEGAPGDLRSLFKERPGEKESICADLEFHPDGPSAMFPSGQLSFTRAGYVEPLLPPMRHAAICTNRMQNLLRMDYTVHDFAFMCRNLNPQARTVFIDMGAALDHAASSPAMYIPWLYPKFGFHFDHIFAFEIKTQDPKKVFEAIPESWISSYHWMNVGVSPEKESRYNPLYSILGKFSKDDFIVVKLDIDTSWIEIPLANQLLTDPLLYEKVDQFYFEHHVHLGELARSWGHSMNGTIKDSLTLFRQLREKGVAAHFWP